MFTKDLNTIISSFKKVQSDLEAFIKAKTADKVKKESEIIHLKDDITVLQIQIKQADAIKTNVDKLIGG